MNLKRSWTITTASMFAAIGVILGAYTIQVGNYLKIGFSGIANQFVYYLFGPVVGCFYGGALDILKYLVKPTGAFFPGWTLSAMAAGVIYGCFFYKKPLSLVRVFVAELTVSIICNMLLGTLWLQNHVWKGILCYSSGTRDQKSGYVAGQFPVILLFDLDDGAYRGISSDPSCDALGILLDILLEKVYNKKTAWADCTTQAVFFV